MKKIFFLMVVLLSGLFVSCNNKPQPEDQGGSEKEAILRTIELYMEGSRQAGQRDYRQGFCGRGYPRRCSKRPVKQCADPGII